MAVVIVVGLLCCLMVFLLANPQLYCRHPSIGETWIYACGNPFDRNIYYVVDVKGSWVQYRRLDSVHLKLNDFLSLMVRVKG